MTDVNIFIFFFLVSVFISLIYSGFIGWLSLVIKIKKNDKTEASFTPYISLIIVFRNEEKNLPFLFQSLINQDYPQRHLEIIFVDDSSEDNSLDLVNEFKIKNTLLSIRVFKLAEELPGAFGKKMALLLAFNKAKGDYFVLTDADCRFDTNFLKSRLRLFETEKIKLISAMVLIDNCKSIFSKTQALENLSLMATTAATTAGGIPVLSNGANLAFERNAWLELNENAMLNHEISGDDVFLLHSFKKHFGTNAIAFDFAKESSVYTYAQDSVIAFFNQRIRWVSKSKSYKDAWIILISILVLLCNINLLIAGFASFFSSYYFYLFVFLFSTKFFIDFIVLYTASKLYNQTKLLFLYPVMQIFYPLFIVLSVIFGSIMPYRWKGRKY